MKTFLNVLYRKILYKIPLKFLLILLAVCAIFIASFSNAGLVKTSYQQYIGSQNDKSYVNNTCDMICINPDPSSCSNINMAFNLNHGAYAWSIYGQGDIGSTYGFCTSEHTVYFSTFDSCNFTIDCYNFTEYTKAQCKSEYDLIEDSECVGMDSMTCQTTYNLIPISSVDSNYCQTNNLCSSSSDCPSGGSGVDLTELYINNILHVGAPTILMNIPEEINREYAYTQGGNIMNIDVYGYNVDYEKMQDIIDIQNYKPDSTELSTIVSQIVPLFVPGLCIILLLYFIFRFIKKIF